MERYKFLWRTVKNGRGCLLTKYVITFQNSPIPNLITIHLVLLKLLHIFKPVLQTSLKGLQTFVLTG